MGTVKKKKAKLKLVYGEAALLANGTLAIADLHLGIESSFRRDGIFLPSMTASLQDRINGLLAETRAKRLVVVGDVKHSIDVGRQEERELPSFFSAFEAEVHIVKGNHDGNIADILPSEVNIHPSGGFLLDRTYYAHGNAWPGGDFSKAERLVIGHLHPAIEFRDRLGGRVVERCWLRCRISPKSLEKRYPAARAKEAIVMPAFNRLAGGMPLNSLKPEGPLLRSGIIDVKKADIYLLDGVHIGRLGDMKGF